MCGIAGILNSKLSEAQEQEILGSMRHRGPDGSGVFRNGPAALFHTRLAIQDLSSNGNQPMYSEDGRFVIVFNGEIYNHEAIRQQLKAAGQSFRSSSDTETLLYAYIHFGASVLPQLNGIFAFAVYDTKEETFFVARDAFGVKPLYYNTSGDQIAFASEIKTLCMLSGFRLQPDYEGLFQTLMLQWPIGKNCGWKNVTHLLPGYSLRFGKGIEGIQCVQWLPKNMPATQINRSEAEWVDLLDKELQEAVHRQLLSDKPVGFFLSGGLDSSLLLALAKKAAPEHTFQAFTVNPGPHFRKEGFSDDLVYARKVAAQLQVRLDVTEVNTNLLEQLDDMVFHLEEPLSDAAPLFVQEISRKAKGMGYDVLISGTGGDDIFTGYRRHQALAYESLLEKLPLVVRSLLRHAGTLFPENPVGRRIRKFTATIDQDAFSRMCAYFFWSDKATVLGLFAPDIRNKINSQCIENAFQATIATLKPGLDRIEEMLALEQYYFLPNHNLNYTDKMGMAEGVEIRVPYLDNQLAAFAASIPASLKMKGNKVKYLLRQVARRYLPSEIIDRPKTGFGAPIRTWMQGDKLFQQQVWERLQHGAFAPQLFDPESISKIYQETISRQKDHSYTLLALLCIESWLRQFSAS